MLMLAAVWGLPASVQTAEPKTGPEGPLGVIQEGAYADMILVDGNPLENPDIVGDASSDR